jgi:hypothetical protein
VVVAAVFFSENARIKRAIRKAPRTLIADFPEHGAAKIVGTVRLLDESIPAPLTKRDCAYYETTVEEHRRRGKHSRWVTIIRESGGVPFLLEDSSGRALVDPRGARVALVVDNKSRSGTFDDATAEEEEFLQRHNRQSKGWFLNRSLRYREGVLEIGETVTVFGAGVREADPDGAGQAGGYRELPPTRIRLGGSSKSALMISDDPSVRQ